MSLLRLRTLTLCDKTIVSTRGDVDIHTAALLEAHLRVLARQGRHRLVVNLSGTHYLDSTGLAALMRIHRALHAEGGALTLMGCQPTVSRVLHMVGFHHLFIIEDRLPPRTRRFRSLPAYTPVNN